MVEEAFGEVDKNSEALNHFQIPEHDEQVETLGCSIKLICPTFSGTKTSTH